MEKSLEIVWREWKRKKEKLGKLKWSSFFGQIAKYPLFYAEICMKLTKKFISLKTYGTSSDQFELNWTILSIWDHLPPFVTIWDHFGPFYGHFEPFGNNW